MFLMFRFNSGLFNARFLKIPNLSPKSEQPKCEPKPKRSGALAYRPLGQGGHVPRPLKSEGSEK